MTPEQHVDFPTARRFLEVLQSGADRGSERADEFSSRSGEKLPATLDGLGTVLSILYRLACCQWGCNGGDHQIEWLTGRVVNQSTSSLRLLRAGYYDEALMLTRGIGEIANLLWLFRANGAELNAWKAADRTTRINKFGPGAVRKRLKHAYDFGPPIADDRYQQLCEVGTHPIPGICTWPLYWHRSTCAWCFSPAGGDLCVHDRASLCRGNVGSSYGRANPLERCAEKGAHQRGCATYSISWFVHNTEL
jgi:hypothetical protein